MLRNRKKTKVARNHPWRDSIRAAYAEKCGKNDYSPGVLAEECQDLTYGVVSRNRAGDLIVESDRFADYWGDE